MLLPSAFPCEAPTVLARPSRPRLPSFEPYQSIKAPPPSHAILESCRALQSILGGPDIRSPSPCPTNPFAFGPDLRQSNHAPKTRSNLRKFVPLPLKAPPRGPNKRTRDETEADDETLETCEKRAVCTPKRQRRVPLAMPLGLTEDDFYHLETTTVDDVELDMRQIFSDGAQHGSKPELDPSYSELSEASHTVGTEWTAEDDKMFVDTVLQKLQLSRADWNGCGETLSRRNQDTIGHKWRLLAVDGDAVLRRGSGMQRQVDLDVASW